MEIDVKKLINEVSKHPQIYNPDHKDFSNKQIRDDIFNTLISKEFNGIKGEILERKWNQILNKYASFIRKLSNDDSSERILERFMEWPWTKYMRIFKPYVRKQFAIPEFQPAEQIPEMDPDSLPVGVPRSLPEFRMLPTRPSTSIPLPAFSRMLLTPRQEFPHPLSMPVPDHPADPEPEYPAEPEPEYPAEPEPENLAEPRPGLPPRAMPSAPRQEFSHSLSMPTTEYSVEPKPAGLPPRAMPPAPRQEFSHPLSMPRPSALTAGPAFAHPVPSPRRDLSSRTPLSNNYDGAPGLESMRFSRVITLPIPHPMFAERLLETSYGDDGGSSTVFQDVASLVGLYQPTYDYGTEDDDDDTDDEVVTDKVTETDQETAVVTDGQPETKKKRKTSDGTSGNAENGDDVTANDDRTDRENDKNVLPDLPQPKPVAERRPSDFTAHEHMFLAWAKTMSTFNSRRQATIKMKINKIMSEAEFEELDDEFFAAKEPIQRTIYTSRW